MSKPKIKKGRSDIVFNIIVYSVLAIGMCLVLYPLYFVVIASICDPNAIYAGKVYLIPKGVTLEGYQKIFEYGMIWKGYLNTIIYTSVGTTVNVVLTICAAYTLSKKFLPGKNFFMMLILFTMFFSGGLIPTYLIVQKLKLINTMWALILPAAVGPWNLIIARTFFQTTIPDELCEAAYIDGSSDFYMFWKIILPLSKPIIAIMVLFYAVGYWNSYFSALIYIRDQAKYPLQLVLREILIQNDASSMADGEAFAKQLRDGDLIKYGAIIVSSLPVLCLYPFVQKYFVQGVMIGAVKG